MTVASSAEQLAAAGVEEPERVLRRFGALWPEGIVPPRALAALLESADPSLAVAGLERLRAAEPAATVAVQADPELAGSLVTVLGASALVVRLLLADPRTWNEGLAQPDPAIPIGTLVPTPHLGAGTDLDTLARALRALKRRRMLRIAVRDLLHFATLDQTTTALSELAADAL